jgi:hypothetical protein
MLVGSFIAFFNLLNHDDLDAILNIEEDAPIADAHPVAVLMTGQSLYVPAIRPMPECFHRIVDLLADLPAPDFVKLPIGFGSPVDAVHELLYKFKISLRQEKIHLCLDAVHYEYFGDTHDFLMNAQHQGKRMARTLITKSLTTDSQSGSVSPLFSSLFHQKTAIGFLTEASTGSWGTAVMTLKQLLHY